MFGTLLALFVEYEWQVEEVFAGKRASTDIAPEFQAELTAVRPLDADDRAELAIAVAAHTSLDEDAVRSWL